MRGLDFSFHSFSHGELHDGEVLSQTPAAWFQRRSDSGRVRLYCLGFSVYLFLFCMGTLISDLESRSIMKVFSCVDGSLYHFFYEQTQAGITCFSMLLMFHHRVSSFEDQKKLTLKTYCVCVRSVTAVVSASLQTPGLSLPGTYVHGNSPGKNTGMGCHSIIQGIFPVQGLNPHFLHCRQILYLLSHQGSLRTYQCHLKDDSSHHTAFQFL